MSLVSVLLLTITAAHGAVVSTTATNLSVTASGSGVSSVAGGTAVTLTAAVLSGGTAVTRGQVSFCDATAAHCTDIHLLGTAQLTAAGTASIVLRPGLGSKSYKAVFAGTSNFLGSSSNAASLGVTGAVPTTTTITSSGAAGNYTLTAKVSGSGVDVAPSGTVSFVDTTNSNAVVGSAVLGGGTLTQSLAPQVIYPTSTSPWSIASGDFNGDGKPDLAVVNQGSNTVGILLGKGDGTFNPQVSYPTGTTPSSVVVGDFNADGKQDLAIANRSGNTVGILFGRGDGTFNTQVTYAVGAGPTWVAAADFNHDGIPDLVTANTSGNTVSVLLGKGDGTFNTQVSYPVGAGANSVATGDLNGDGAVDLVVANITANTVSVLLGKGDGTFNPQVAYPAGSSPYQVVLVDLKGDGSPDVAVTDVSTNTISVLLGNGDGTLRTAATYAIGTSPYGLSVADVNLDGIPDLIGINESSISVLSGKGDGTFNGQVVSTVAGANAITAAVADFNGDGVPDIAVTDADVNTISVLLGQVAANATATATGINPVGTGTSHLVKASYPGDGAYAPSSSSTVSLATQKATTGLTLTADPTTATLGQSVTLSAILSPYAVGGLTTNTESISFYANGSLLGVQPLSSGVASLSLTTLPLGIDTLTAGYAGDANFTASSAALPYVVAAPASYTAPNTAVGGTSATQTAYLTFRNAATLNSSLASAIQVVTQGAAGLDFKYVAGGTGACTAGSTYAAGASCAIQYSFSPQVPGLRLGGIQLVDGSNNVVASTLLNGTGTGPQAVIYPGVQSVPISTSTNYPGVYAFELATDAAGSLYVGDPSNGKLYKYNVAGNTYTLANTFATAGSFAAQMAIDGAGNLYYIDNNYGQLFKAAYNAVTKTYASPTVVLTGVGNLALAIDTAGNLYVSPNGTQVVKEMPNGSGGYTASAPLFTLGNTIIGLTVDASGTLYVADANAVYKETYSAGSYTQTVIGSGYSNANGIVVDAAGDVYVSTNSFAGISMFVPNGSAYTRTTIGSGIGAINGVAMDANGNLYASGTNGGVPSVFKISVSGGQTYSYPTPTMVGSTDTTDGAKNPVLTNIGNMPLAVSSVNLSGTANFFFGAFSASTGSTPATVAPAGTVKIPVTFAPITAGSPDTGSLIVSDNSLNVAAAVQTTTLSGTALQGQTSIVTANATAIAGSPAALSATFAYGGVKPTGTVTFNVASGTPVAATCVAGAGTETCTALYPTTGLAAGTTSYVVAIAADANYTANSGTGTLTVVPTSFTAPTTAVGSSATAQTATMFISTPGTVGAINVLTQGIANLDFTLAPGGTCAVGQAYNAGDTCTVLYNFSPKAPGQRLGGISVVNSTGTVLSSAFLSGTGTGPVAVFPTASAKSTVAGVAQPTGLAMDAAGNVYVTDYTAGTVLKFTAVNGVIPSNPSIQTLASGVPRACGVTVDGVGNVFALSTTNNSVVEIPFNGTAYGTPVAIVTGEGAPCGAAVDAKGNVYFSNQGSGTVREVLASTGGVPSHPTVITVASGFPGPQGEAIDANGNVFVISNGSNLLYKVPFSNGSFGMPASVAIGSRGFFGITMDGSGNLYLGPNNTSPILEVQAVNGSIPMTAPSVLNLGSGFGGPRSMAVDGSGNLFVADFDNKAVTKLDLTDGPALAFPDTTVGATSAALSAPVLNNGNATLAISGLATTSLNFAVDATTTTCGSASPVTSGARCNVGATFTPTAGGALNASLNITDNNLNTANTVQALSLTGNGIAAVPTITVADASVVYGTATATLSAKVAYLGSSAPAGGFRFTVGSGASVTASCTGTTSPLLCTASYPVATLTASSYSINGTLTADANVASGTGSGTLTVTQATPVLNVVSSSASFSTSSTTLSTTLAFTGANAPSGPVTFQVGSGPVVTATCAGASSPLTCSASYPLATAAVGANQINVNVAADTNYAATSATGTLTVANATATITPADASIVYGAATTTLTGSVVFSGATAPLGPFTFAVGARAAVVATCSGTTSPLSCTASYVTSNLVPNTYPITLAMAADTRFAVSTGSATLTVTPAVPAFSVMNSTVSYGTATTVLSGTLSFTGVVPSGAVTFTVDNGTAVAATCSGTVSPITCTATYPSATLTPQAHSVKVSVAADANYSANSGTGTLTVTATTPVITVANQSITFGNAQSTLSMSVSYTGVAPTGAVTFTVDGGAAVTATCSGTGSPRTCTAGYPTASLTTATHTITATTATDAIYPASSATGTLTVTPAVMVVNVGNQSISFGTASAPLSATVSFPGAVPSGAVSFTVDNGPAVIATCSGKASPLTCTAAYASAMLSVQSHTIKVSVAADANYQAAGANGTLNVTAGTPVITVANQSGSFGSASTSLSATLAFSGSVAPSSGLSFSVDGGAAVSATCTGTAPPLSCTATYPIAALSVGPHTTTASTGADANYKAATGTGALTIAVTTATINFNLTDHVYGDPAFTVAATSNATGAFTYSVVSGPATIAGSIVTITGVGTVVLQANQAADANFSAGSKQASFSVAAASLSAAANNATRVYGAANPAFSGAVTGAKGSDTFTESFTTIATATSAVGTYAIVPAVKGSNLADYTTTVTNGTLTVTQAPALVNLTASAASLNPGANLTLTAAVASTTTGTPTGPVTFYDNGTALSTVALTNGTAVFNTTSLGAGATHSITVSYGGDANFLASATALGTSITIGQLDFTFTTTGPTAYTALPGAVATYGFAISPNFTSYAGAVNFTVTGLPAGATFTFSPASLSATSGAQALVLSVQTPKTLAKNGAAPGSSMERGLPMLALLLLPGLGSRRVRRKLGARMLMFLLLAAGLGSASLLTGCGANNGFQLQPEATYTLTVTATSGSLQHSQTVTLTVQ